MAEIAEESLRIDVWLWRARLYKTRALAARAVAAGRIRLTRSGVQRRLTKPAAAVRAGDELVFAIAGRIHALRVTALGERRGPPAEARALYRAMENS